MANYVTSFSEYAIGVQPSDWTERFNDANSTWTVTSASGVIFLRNTMTSDGLRFISWDDIDADANRADVEVLTKVRSSSISGAQFQIRVRGSGTSGSPTAYTILYNGSNGRFEMFKDVAGVGTLLTTITASLSANTFYWLRYRVVGTALKFKFWIDGAAEPGTWNSEITDSDIAAAGWVGLGAFTKAGNRDYDVVAVGTNGDTAALGVSPEARMTQLAMLVLDAPEADARMTQACALVLSLIPDAADGVRMTQATMLALAEFEAGVRMTQAVALVLADQVNCLTRWAQTWTITRTDGLVFAFTSLDRALTFRGIEHLPCNSMLASAVELSTVVGATGNMELNGILSDSGVSEADLYNGLFDGASIEVWMVPWDNSGGEIPFRLMGGVVGTNGHGETSFNQEILTPGAQLAQRALLETYTPGCRYGFGSSVDSRCPVDLVALTVSGSVTGTAIPNASTTATRRIFTDSTRAEADGFFNLGRLTWTGGPNAGAVSEIKDFTGGQFILWEALLSPIGIGDTYDATPGCDKSAADHLLFNADMLDFGGFPMVPGSDSILQSPDAKG